MMRAQTRNELSRGVMDLLGSLVENTELADVMVRANDGEELTSTEHYIFRTQSERVFRYWENVHYQYRMGLYDDTEYAAHLESWRDYLAYSEALVEYWCANRHAMSQEFSHEIDSLMTSHSCSTIDLSGGQRRRD